MISGELRHQYTFVVTLLFILGATGIFVFNTPSPTGYAFYGDYSQLTTTQSPSTQTTSSGTITQVASSGTTQPLTEYTQPGTSTPSGTDTSSIAKPSQCGGYFGDTICDDSKADCGVHYKSYSEIACNECQTLKNGKPGFDNCVGADTVVSLGLEEKPQDEIQNVVYDASDTCEAYFGDKVCDDSKADCGVHYKSYSEIACNECQTLKNGKPGFDNCVGEKVEEEQKTTPATDTVQGTLLEGTTKSYPINAKNNQVTLDYVDSKIAKFTVNSKATPLLSVGKSHTFADGVKITLNNIYYESYATGKHSATFSLSLVEVVEETEVQIPGYELYEAKLSGEHCYDIATNPDSADLDLKGTVCSESKILRYRKIGTNEGVFVGLSKITEGKKLYEEYLSKSTSSAKADSYNVFRLEPHELGWMTTSNTYDLIFTQEFTYISTKTGFSYSYGFATGTNAVTQRYIELYPMDKVAMDKILVEEEQQTTTSAAGVKVTLTEGSKKWYLINTKNNLVILDYVGSKIAKFTVNGKATPLLSVGKSHTFADGVKITLHDIYNEDFAGGIRTATFSLSLEEVVEVVEEWVICVDYDHGKAYYVRGDTGDSSSPDITYLDVCKSGGSILTEFYCEGTPGNRYVAKSEYTCPNGCKDGVCLDGEGTYTLTEGSTKGYPINAKNNQVRLNYVYSKTAQFTVNGISTPQLSVGKSHTFSDGVKITLHDIYYESFAGGTHTATFSFDLSEFIPEEEIPGYEIYTIFYPLGEEGCWYLGDDPDNGQLESEKDMCIESKNLQYRKIDSNKGVSVDLIKVTKGKKLYEDYILKYVSPAKIGSYNVFRTSKEGLGGITNSNIEELGWMTTSNIYDSILTREFTYTTYTLFGETKSSTEYVVATGTNAVTQKYLGLYPIDKASMNNILSSCTDTDAWIDSAGTIVSENYNVKGTAKDNEKEYTDYCSSSEYVREFYCSEVNGIQSTSHKCISGCKDGACIDLTSSCKDLDGGIDFNKAGDLQIYGKDGISYTVSERCIDVNTVEELYCFYWPNQNISYNCPNGCKDGACLPVEEDPYPPYPGTDTSSTQTTTSAVGIVQGTLLEGTTKTYTINGKNYAVSLDYVDADSVKFTINGVATRDLLVGETDKISDGIVIGIVEIRYEPFANGVHDTTFSLTPPNAFECMDSDGENYFEKGTTIGKVYDEITIEKFDECIENYQGKKNKFVREWVCKDNNLLDTNFECPNGCKDGACLPLEVTDPYSEIYTQSTTKPSQCEGYFGDPICDDSKADCGEHYKSYSEATCDECQTYKKGKLGFDKCVGSGTTVSLGLEEESKTNSCQNSCGGKSNTGNCWCDEVSLPSNNNDACDDIATYCPEIVGLNKNTEVKLGLEESQKGNCIDSDGGLTYYVKGTAKDNENEYTDSCSSSESVLEAFCSEDILEPSFISPFGAHQVNHGCPNGCEDGACLPVEEGKQIITSVDGSIVTDILSEGQTKTYTINGIDYEIAVDFVSSTFAKFTINGKATPELQVNYNSYKITDGMSILVDNIYYESFAGGIHDVTYVILIYDFDEEPTKQKVIGPATKEESQKGSCEGYCNTKSPGGCWCDKLSIDYGDSCSDIATYCPDMVPTSSIVTTTSITTQTGIPYSANYPVIFVHGWTADLTTFEDMQNKLNNEYIAKDNGGMYASTQCTAGSLPKYTSVNFEYYEDGQDKGIESYADKLASVINTLKSCTGSSEVTIVAHSMGGLISRRYMQKYGDDSVKKVIMLETPNYGAPLAWGGALAKDSTDAWSFKPESNFLTELNSNEAECNYRNKFVTVGSITPLGVIETITWAAVDPIRTFALLDVCAVTDNWLSFLDPLLDQFSFLEKIQEDIDSFWENNPGLPKLPPESHESAVVPAISAKLYGALNNEQIYLCSHAGTVPEGPSIVSPECTEAYKIVKDHIE